MRQPRTPTHPTAPPTRRHSPHPRTQQRHTTHTHKAVRVRKTHVTRTHTSHHSSATKKATCSCSLQGSYLFALCQVSTFICVRRTSRATRETCGGTCTGTQGARAGRRARAGAGAGPPVPPVPPVCPGRLSLSSCTVPYRCDMRSHNSIIHNMCWPHALHITARRFHSFVRGIRRRAAWRRGRYASARAARRRGGISTAQRWRTG